MATADQDVLTDRTVQTLRVIVLALVSGLVLFLAVCLSIGPLGTKPAPAAPGPPPLPADGKLPVLTVTAFLFAATILPLSVALPGILGDSARKKLADKDAGGDVAGLVAVYQAKTILAAALSEGPAFFAGTAYLIEGNRIALALAAALTLFVAVRFPVRSRFDHWLDGQLGRLRLERRDAASF